MLSIILIALSLSMDAFAVSVTNGLTTRGFSLKHALTTALYFGGFQFIMPLAGSCIAGAVSSYISSLGPYISFALLAFIGGRMVYGAALGRGGAQAQPAGVAGAALGHGRLLAMAVATSIDAFAVGVSFAFMEVDLLLSCAVIGVVTFAVCTAGGLLGRYIPGVSGARAETVGGLVLIGIGLRMLLEGLFR